MGHIGCGRRVRLRRHIVGRRDCRLSVCAEHVIRPLSHGGGNDNGIADKAQRLGYLLQKHIAQNRGKEHLHVVKDGDLLGGGEAVRRRDEELSARCRNAREQEPKKLHARHGLIACDQEGEGHNGGEHRKEEYRHHAALTLDGEDAHAGVGKSRARAAAHARKRGQDGHVKAGIDNANRARKGNEHKYEFRDLWLFAQQEHGKEDGKEGGKLVEDGGVRDAADIVDGIKIQDDAE